MANTTKKTTKKTSAAAKKFAKQKLTILISVENERKPDILYVCGNDASLGAWQPEKAAAIKRNADGFYMLTLDLAKGSAVEFKILADRCWCAVEKGMFGEEIANHCAIADGIPANAIIVYNWNNQAR